MRRLVMMVAAALVAVALPGRGGSAAPACSKAAAKAAILASSLLERWKDEARHKYGPHEGLARVLCVDFTRDGRTLAATFASGGTAGDIAWVAFRRAGNGWKLALARLRSFCCRPPLAHAARGALAAALKGERNLDAV